MKKKLCVSIFFITIGLFSFFEFMAVYASKVPIQKISDDEICNQIIKWQPFGLDSIQASYKSCQKQIKHTECSKIKPLIDFLYSVTQGSVNIFQELNIHSHRDLSKHLLGCWKQFFEKLHNAEPNVTFGYLLKDVPVFYDNCFSSTQSSSLLYDQLNSLIPKMSVKDVISFLEKFSNQAKDFAEILEELDQNRQVGVSMKILAEVWRNTHQDVQCIISYCNKKNKSLKGAQILLFSYFDFLVSCPLCLCPLYKISQC